MKAAGSCGNCATTLKVSLQHLPLNVLVRARHHVDLRCDARTLSIRFERAQASMDHVVRDDMAVVRYLVEQHGVADYLGVSEFLYGIHAALAKLFRVRFELETLQEILLCREK